MEKDLVKKDEKPLLGIYAKSSTTCREDEKAKNSINTKVKKDKVVSKIELKKINQKNRFKRYQLLRNARKIFLAYAIANKVHNNNFHKISRTINCKYALSAGYDNVEVHCDNKSAYYVGLQTCGSVWTCPICAARVAEVRRKEIEKAVGNAYGMSYQSIMVTLTFPHSKKMPLKELLSKQSMALKYFREGNVWNLFKKRIDFQGLVRALELTYGANGWHPHTHELWFVSPKLTEKDIKTFITERWIKCLEKSDLVSKNRDVATNNALKKRAVDIKMNCKSSDYLSKNDNLNWGIDREIAKAANKGKSKGLHPFELLEDVVGNCSHKFADDELNIEKFHSQLFIEYAEAMKGKSQLYWSQGLKEKLSVDILTDEEICEDEEDTEEDEKLFDREIKFTDEEWEVIAKREMRAYVLTLLENAGEKVDSKYEELLKELAVDVAVFRAIQQSKINSKKASNILDEHTIFFKNEIDEYIDEIFDVKNEEDDNNYVSEFSREELVRINNSSIRKQTKMKEENLSTIIKFKEIVVKQVKLGEVGSRKFFLKNCNF